MTADDILQFQRRNPLAADLDHVLDPVGDLDVARLVHIGDIAGMQETATPEVLRIMMVL